MKRTVSKKLVLGSTTLRTLSADALHNVGGGQTLATCSALCSDRICPDTQFVHGCNSFTNHCV